MIDHSCSVLVLTIAANFLLSDLLLHFLLLLWFVCLLLLKQSMPNQCYHAFKHASLLCFTVLQESRQTKWINVFCVVYASFNLAVRCFCSRCVGQSMFSAAVLLYCVNSCEAAFQSLYRIHQIYTCGVSFFVWMLALAWLSRITFAARSILNDKPMLPCFQAHIIAMLYCCCCCNVFASCFTSIHTKRPFNARLCTFLSSCEFCWAALLLWLQTFSVMQTLTMLKTLTMLIAQMQVRMQHSYNAEPYYASDADSTDKIWNMLLREARIQLICFRASSTYKEAVWNKPRISSTCNLSHNITHIFCRFYLHAVDQKHQNIGEHQL